MYIYIEAYKTNFKVYPKILYLVKKVLIFEYINNQYGTQYFGKLETMLKTCMAEGSF